jgi:hypothetical protein
MLAAGSTRRETSMGATTASTLGRAPAIVAAASALLCGAAGATAAEPRIDRYTPLVPSVMSTPRWFEGADDRAHLVYELQLVNGFNVPVTVTGVSVRDAGTGRRVAAYGGAKLRAAMTLMASPAEPETTVPGSRPASSGWTSRSPAAAPSRPGSSTR